MVSRPVPAREFLAGRVQLYFPCSDLSIRRFAFRYVQQEAKEGHRIQCAADHRSSENGATGSQREIQPAQKVFKTRLRMQRVQSRVNLDPK